MHRQMKCVGEGGGGTFSVRDLFEHRCESALSVHQFKHRPGASMFRMKGVGQDDDRLLIHCWPIVFISLDDLQ